MTVVELKKMVVDTTLNDLKHEMHHIIDSIASDKAFDQYNAKCGEADLLREALKEAKDGLRYWEPQTAHGAIERARICALVDAALQPKEGV